MKIRPDCKFLHTFRRRSAPANFEINSMKLVGQATKREKRGVTRQQGRTRHAAHAHTHHTRPHPRAHRAPPRARRVCVVFWQAARRGGGSPFIVSPPPRTPRQAQPQAAQPQGRAPASEASGGPAPHRGSYPHARPPPNRLDFHAGISTPAHQGVTAHTRQVTRQSTQHPVRVTRRGAERF